MEKNLFDEFSPIHKHEWIAQAAKDLMDENIMKALMTDTFEGLSVPPFFNHEDRGNAQWLQPFENRFQHPSPKIGFGPRSWSNLVCVNEPDDKKANQEIKKVLENGADGVILELSGNEELSGWLDGVTLEGVSIWLRAKENPVEIMRRFFKWSDQLGVPKNRVAGGVIWDSFASAFEVVKTKESIKQELVGIHQASIPYPRFKGLTLNTGIYQQAGGSAVQELGYGWGELVEIIDVLAQSGFSAESIFQNILIQSSVGGDFFMEMAKLKAMRIGVFQLAQLYETSLQPEDFYLFASTSVLTKSARSPHYNMIRNTTEALSAILGGCNALYVIPHDSVAKTPDDFSKRMARNVSLILKEESFLNKVIDPAAGSYYLNYLIDNIYDHALELLQTVENGGGWWSSYERGDIQNAVKASRQRKIKRMLEEKSVVVGVNKYGHPDETEEPQSPGGNGEEPFQLKVFSLDSLLDTFKS